MAMTEVPQVKYEITGDNITVEQDIGCGDTHSISMHRIHFDHIASKLHIPSLSITAQTIRRRLEIVEATLNTLASSEYYRSEIVERCGSGIEFITELDALCLLATEFLKDIVDCGDQLAMGI